MKTHSSQPDLLDTSRLEAVRLILLDSEIVLFSCLYWRLDEADVIMPRALENDFLYIPVAGRFRGRIGESEAVLEPGRFMMVPEGAPHVAWMDDEGEDIEVYALHLHAYTRLNQSLLAAFPCPFGHCEPIAAWAHQFALLTHLCGRDQEAGGRFGRALIRNLLIDQLIHDNLPAAPPTVGDRRIWKAIVQIREQTATPPTVDRLAREAGLSTAQFRKLFARHTGQSPKAYAQQLRLRQARALLLSNPSLPIKEVALRTGFNDPHYLNAVFKQHYGVPPSRVQETLDA